MPWLNVPHLQQSKQAWCLPACIAMISAYWEQPLLQEDIARWLNATDIGTPASRIQRLSRYGFDIHYGEGSLASVAAWLEQQCPVIVFIRTGELPTWSVDTPHAVVLAGIEIDTAFLFDPAKPFGPDQVPLAALLLAWSYLDYVYAVLRPTR